MVYYFNVCMVLVVVVGFCVLNLFVFYIYLIVFYKKFVVSVFILMLWVFWIGEDSYIVVKYSIDYYIVGEEDVKLF